MKAKHSPQPTENVTAVKKNNCDSFEFDAFKYEIRFRRTQA